MADKRPGLHTLFSLYSTYGKMDLLWFLRDTRYCLLYLVTDVICAGASVGGVFLLSARFGGLGGMEEKELLFLLSYCVLIDGVYSLFFAGNNMGQISRIIGRGQLDHCIIQPVPLWMQLITGGFCPFSASSKLLCGAVLCFYSIRQLGLAAGPGWLLSFLLSVLASTGIVLACVYLLSSLAFLAPAAAEEIAMTALSLFDMLKAYPLGALPVFWQTVFCTAVPVGLAAWLPSRALLRLSFPLWTVLAAALFITAASLVFRKGLRYYAAHGSPRYSGFGHR